MNDHAVFGVNEWMAIGSENCAVWISRRPSYCDRGNYLAGVEAWGEVRLDEADLWPRYYFSLSCAMSEIEAWLAKRRYPITIEWKIGSTDLLLPKLLTEGESWKSDYRSKFLTTTVTG